MTRHLWPDELSALVDDALSPAARGEAERHLAGCPRCREALAALVANDRALAAVADPGDAYFDTFAARVEDRIRAAGMRGAQQRAQQAGGLAGWFRSPRKLATVSAVAVVVVAAGVAMWAHREQQPMVPTQALTPAAGEGPRPAPQEAVPAPSPVASNAPAAGAGSAVASGPLAARPQAAAKKAASREPAPRKASTMSADQLASGAVAQNEPAPGAAQPGAAAPAPEMARFAAPQHLQEMRRDSVTGEEVPVPSQRDQAFLARPPVSSPTPTGRIAKPRYAEPASAGAAAAGTRRGELCGVVKDNAGHPVAGAAVTIAATRASATTDRAGSFCIPATGASATLAIRASGFLPKTVTGKPGGRVTVELEAQPAQSTARAIAQKQGDLGAQSAQVAAAFENLPAYPRSVARNAERLTAVADRLQSAGGYDHAAGEWERLLPFVKGGPLETEVRWQSASARMHAWQSGANDHRRQDAADAIVTYLAKAPISDRRDQAQKWLEQVKR